MHQSWMQSVIKVTLTLLIVLNVRTNTITIADSSSSNLCSSFLEFLYFNSYLNFGSVLSIIHQGTDCSHKNSSHLIFSIFSSSFVCLNDSMVLETINIRGTIDDDNESMGKNVAIIFPSELQDFYAILTKIFDYEVNLSIKGRRKSQIFVLWPTQMDKTDGKEEEPILQYLNGSVNSQNVSSSLMKSPLISNEIYIVFYRESSREKTFTSLYSNYIWKFLNIYIVGRENMLHFNYIPLDPVEKSLLRPFSYRKLTNVTVKATFPEAVLQAELSYEVDIATGNVKLINGLVVDLITSVQSQLNFRLDFILGSTWIQQSSKKEWEGIGAHLVEKPERFHSLWPHAADADIAIVKSTLLAVRASSFTFLHPHFQEQIQAIFEQPPVSSIRNIFVEPFQPSLWIIWIVLWIFICSYVVLFSSIKKKQNQLNQIDDDMTKSCIFWCMAFATQQGWYTVPQSISFKIIFSFSSAMGLIVYLVYSAALFSSLSAFIVPIKSFQELLDSNMEIRAFNASTTVRSVIQIHGDDNENLDSGESQPKKNLLKQRFLGLSSDEASGVGLVFQQVAVIVYQDTFFFFAKNTWNKSHQHLCSKVYLYPVSRIPFRSGFTVPKHSPYKEIFNQKILVSFTNGLVRRSALNYLRSQRGPCTKPTTKTEIQLDITDVFSAYIIIALGFLFAFVVFGFELIPPFQLGPKIFPNFKKYQNT